MIRHIVLIKRKEGVTEDAIKTAFVEGCEMLRGIDGVASVNFLPMLPSAKHGYNHALVAMIRDAEALKAYGPHPLHRKMAEFTLPLMGEALVTDIDEGG